VEGKQFIELHEAVRIELFDCPGDGAVQFLPLVEKNRVISDFLDQIVLEEILRFTRLAVLQDELQRLEFRKVGRHVVLPLHHLLQQGTRELAADD
jgi:hypothetical protein